MSRNDLRKKNEPHRIALYIRVSTEEQASNPEGSIKSQEQRLRNQVALKNQEVNFGEIVSVYIDRAKSGKDTNRPELQKLLNAVRNKEITLVMVSELSRLSRSIKDFCEMWELMRASGCEFQSLREQFDTTNAAGEMVLFTIANIAQFERRQVSERVTANLQARSARGLYNGGIIPFGYRRNPENKGHLIINKAEAKIVRAAFAVFLKEKSLTAAARHLNKKGLKLTEKCVGGGYRPRLGHFTIGNLHTILRNRAYIGVKVYQVNGVEKEAEAVWKYIVDETTFYRVQEILKKNHGRKKPDSPNRYPFLLSSLTYCSTCGDRLCGKSAHGNGGKIPYYDHAWATKRQGCLVNKVFACKPTRVLAKKLEPAVWEKVEELLKNPSVAEALLKEANRALEKRKSHRDSDDVRERIEVIKKQQEALAQRLSELPASVPATPIYSQMEKLEKLKLEEESKLNELAKEVLPALPIELSDYQEFLRGVMRLAKDPNSKTRVEIAQRLIDKIEITPQTFKLHFLVGKNYIDREEAFLSLQGSNTLTNGWGARIRT